MHASPAEVLSYFWRFNSYDRLGAYVEGSKGNLPRLCRVIPGCRSALQCSIVKAVPPFENRLFEEVTVWCSLPEAAAAAPLDLLGVPDDGYVLAFEPITVAAAAPLPDEWLRDRKVLQCVRAFTRGVYVIQKVASRVSKVTLVQQVILGGFVPAALGAFAVSFFADSLHRMYGHFQRGGAAIDGEVRTDFIERMRADKGDMRVEQVELWARSRNLQDEWSTRNGDAPDTVRASKINAFLKAQTQRPFVRSFSRNFTMSKTTKIPFKNSPLVNLWLRKGPGEISSKGEVVIDISAEE